MTCPECQASVADAEPRCPHCGRAFEIRPGVVLSARYEILQTLGSGGMGVVFRAHDRELDEVVAVKVLRREAALDPVMGIRFRQEIKLARRIRHPNVCAIHEYGQDGNRCYIVMEYVEGTNLREALRRRGRLPPEEAVAIAIQVASGLKAIHAEAIVHRDLKTANLMQTRKRVVRLMDFGVAKLLAGDSGPNATAIGTIVGTPDYMSPEQIQGEAVDGRSDLYSLGIVLFELLTGRRPFHASTPQSIVLHQLNDPPPLDDPSSRLPGPVVPILRRALAKDRDQRFASAAEMRSELQTVLAELPPDASAADTASLWRVGDWCPLTPEPASESVAPVPSRTRGETPPLADHGSAIRDPPLPGEPPAHAALPAIGPVAGTGARARTRSGADGRGLYVGGALLLVAAAVAGVLFLRSGQEPEASVPPGAVASAARPTSAPTGTPDPQAGGSSSLPFPPTPIPASSAPRSSVSAAHSAAAAAVAGRVQPSPQTGAVVTSPVRLQVLVYQDGRESAAGAGVAESVTTGRVFHSRDRIRFGVVASHDGRLVLVQRGSSGSMSAIYPDRRIAHGANSISAGAEILIPQRGWFVFDDKPGTETVYAVFSVEDDALLEEVQDAAFAHGASARTADAQILSELEERARGVAGAISGGRGTAIVRTIVLRHE